MFISADQLLLHAIGDYVFQSDWMAKNKTKSTLAAAIHAICYGLSFLLIPMIPHLGMKPASWLGLAFIVGTHFIIDRFRLARYVIWLKNWLGPNASWEVCRDTGYPPGTPAFLAVWLLIITDNIMHICLNGIAFKLF